MENFLTNLFERYYEKMIKIARKRVFNLYDAEDVVGNCWVSIVRNAEILYRMEETMLYSYLSKTVAHAVIDFYRHKYYFTEIPMEDDRLDQNSFYEVAGESEIEEILQKVMIDECAKRFQPRVVQAFRLLMEGFPGKRVAEIMNISEVTVRGYWLRATRAIKEEYAESQMTWLSQDE